MAEETEVDCDMLIHYVEQHPVIYDQSKKDYHNRDICINTWDTIGKEMKLPGLICRAKWQSLRNQYARYVRVSKKTSSGSVGGKKKKWVFADSLSFLKDFIGQHRKTSDNSQDDDSADETTIDAEEKEEDEGTFSCAEAPLTPIQSFAFSTGGQSKKRQREKPRNTLEQLLASQLSGFFQSRQNAALNEKELPAILHFFQGLLPEIQRLSAKRQRRFKSEVLDILNKLNDEEDDDKESCNLHSSRPPSTITNDSSTSCKGTSPPEIIVLDPRSMYNYTNFHFPQS